AMADAGAASEPSADQTGDTDAAPASAAPAGGIADAGVGEPIAAGRAARPPVLLEKQLPEYPSTARAAGISGEVVLGAVLDQQGRIEEVDVLRSVAALDEAAIRAVKRWRFQPATDDAGRPIRVTLKIPIRFTLR
ncbi:MAG: energy transducer TonB, partial [Candidatus Binatia bacterium]